jgi:quercetin dioxygenase-like cupin family protein
MPVKAQVKPMPQQHSMAEHKFFNPDAIQWQEGPASLPKGAKVSVLEGDLAKEGPFTLRVLFPANYKVGPHWHPAIEHVTVLKGTFYMGAGETYSPDMAKKLEVGAFAVMPAKVVHYGFTTKNEAMIQVHGTGPWGITYVNPADDPRTASK